jgi:hypothetical protein
MNCRKARTTAALLATIFVLTGCSSSLASEEEIRVACAALVGQNHADSDNSIEVVTSIKPQIAVIEATNPNEASILLDGVKSIEADSLASRAEVSLFFLGSILNKSDEETKAFTDSQQEKIDRMEENFQSIEEFCRPFLVKG